MQLEGYVLGWRERIAREEAARAVREVQLRKWAQLAVPVLLDAGARQVILFGSVADGVTTETSDVDLAVVGLPPAQLEAARSRVAELLKGRVAFDLVRREDVGHAVEHAISCGEVLGER